MNLRQPDLFSQPLQPKFAGVTYEAQHDQKRMTGQLLRVFELMKDGTWRTLGEIQTIVGGSEAAISARLRDLRKVQFGGYEVDRRRRGHASRGLWEYRVK